MIDYSKPRTLSMTLALVSLLGMFASTSCSTSAPSAPSTTAAPAAAKPSPASALTSDGLQLVTTTAFARVYVRPGATLKPYTKFALLDCFVSFAPNWRQDMESNFNIPITIDQMKLTETQLASDFKTVFSTQLEQGGFQMVTTAGPGVLVLRPAIINLYIQAPQNMEDPSEETIGQTAGQLTLYLELYDSVTNQLLARVIDPEVASPSDGLFMWQTRAGNITAANEVMTKWADTLRHFMEAAHGAQ